MIAISPTSYPIIKTVKGASFGQALKIKKNGEVFSYPNPEESTSFLSRALSKIPFLNRQIHSQTFKVSAIPAQNSLSRTIIFTKKDGSPHSSVTFNKEPETGALDVKVIAPKKVMDSLVSSKPTMNLVERIGKDAKEYYSNLNK
ncbi:MAG: hypothetical protein VKJ06_02600 [Vampirovibrionales bacterium]|nr:hypothetical protein [Vampirovibrionales bacterium]